MFGRRRTRAAVRDRSDFAALVDATPRADVVGSGTALPAPAVIDFSQQEPPPKPRPFALDWAALAFAIVAPPVGLLLSLLVRAIYRHDRRWSARVATVTTVIGLVLSLCLGAALTAIWIQRQADAEREAIAERARPLCAELTARADTLAMPAYGWPTEPTPLPQTVESMEEYRLLWAEIAVVAPESIRPRVEAIADRAEQLITETTSTLTIDRAGNLAAMTTVTDAAALPDWVDEFCD
jgi:hypothetical protein